MDEGQGDTTLLFIHGLANYGASWKKNIEALSKTHRCIALDLPGNGLSGNSDQNYSISFFTKCIIDFIGRLGLKKVCLVGHSMGGQIALTVALEAPGAVEKLILCAPAGFETFSEMDKMFYQNSMQYMSWMSNDEFNLQQTLHSSFYRFPAGAESMIQDLVSLMKLQQGQKYRAMVDQCVQSMVKESVFSRLKNIPHPALVLFGDMDALIPNRMLHPVSTKDIGLKGTKEMPHALLKMIPQCGHFLHWEKAKEVNAAILEWL